MKKPDILIYLSDQHSPIFSGWGAVPVDTPNLDKLREDGTNFTESYTSCPLCVPARMSMLSSKLPSKTSIYTNFDTLADTTPTFLHPFAAAGYETVLIGRMHFIGQDQRHGFTKRLVGDITPVTWNRPGESLARERGVFKDCFMDTCCTDVIGGGESPVLHYDEAVVEAALEYLSKEHDKPQLIVVGTYGPHYPYVAPKELYLKYLNRVTVPDSFENDMPMNQLLEKKKKDRSFDTDSARHAIAAYCGMIEQMDGQIGRVREAFSDYSRRFSQPSIFCYLSDHGDQVGENRLYGKQTFFEKSAKIPFLFAGDGIGSARSVAAPVSIMDLGPTMCELAGVEFPVETDGISLAKVLTKEEEPDFERAVISQFMAGNFNEDVSYGIMVRKDHFKYITYHGYEDEDMLFDLLTDPGEKTNQNHINPELSRELRNIALTIADPKQEEKSSREHWQMYKWLMAWEKETGMNDGERWSKNPASARDLPEVR
ncbi:sulfatase-like hydrolase/transferase [Lacrimispora sp.]|uniref:sulfatase-like hydrolase/transferase n=1 Tax=Lacrimispora sp. TaxID=2719234 RepID=UPI0029E22646|nr:choline-sulfatase [Lacrimispora sp.]